jgi:hypothetical protein
MARRPKAPRLLNVGWHTVFDPERSRASFPPPQLSPQANRRLGSHHCRQRALPSTAKGPAGCVHPSWMDPPCTARPPRSPTCPRARDARHRRYTDRSANPCPPSTWVGQGRLGREGAPWVRWSGPAQSLTTKPCPLRPLGQVGMAKVDGAARVPKGQRGGGNRTQYGHFEISDNFFSSRSRCATCSDCTSSN